MKELKPFILLIGAIIVTIIVVPLGVPYNFGKSIYETYKYGIGEGLYKFFKYWLILLYQIWCVVKYFINSIAESLDLMWNATAGELLEDLITTEEKTLFGKGDVMVSAAIGEQEIKNKLVPFGKRLNIALSILLGDNHSIESYNKYIYKLNSKK